MGKVNCCTFITKVVDENKVIRGIQFIGMPFEIQRWPIDSVNVEVLLFYSGHLFGQMFHPLINQAILITSPVICGNHHMHDHSFALQHLTALLHFILPHFVLI